MELRDRTRADARGPGAPDDGRPRRRLRRHPRVQRSRRHRRRRARAPRGRARGARSSSSTTARPTRRARGPTAAGARVIRHPYNKGNGAAVKSGIRAATGEFILDHRRRRPAPARGCAAPRRAGSASTTSSSARGPSETQAGSTRRLGNAALNRLASFLTERADSGSDVRVPRRAPRAACSSSSTCCRTASRRRRRRRWRSSRRATTWRSSRSTRGRASARRRFGSRATARSSCSSCCAS